MILATGAPPGCSGETFTELMDHVAQGFEALGAAILVVGVIWSFVLAVVAVRRSGWSAKAYLVLRQRIPAGPCCWGWRSWSPPTWYELSRSRLPSTTTVLGLIVVIRTFLSFSLETEIEGVAPWRRALAGGAGTIRRASASALEPKTPPDTRPAWLEPGLRYAQAGLIATARRSSGAAISPRLRRPSRRRPRRSQSRAPAGCSPPAETTRGVPTTGGNPDHDCLDVVGGDPAVHGSPGVGR